LIPALVQNRKGEKKKEGTANPPFPSEAAGEERGGERVERTKGPIIGCGEGGGKKKKREILITVSSSPKERGRKRGSVVRQKRARSREKARTDAFHSLLIRKGPKKRKGKTGLLCKEAGLQQGKGREKRKANFKYSPGRLEGAARKKRIFRAGMKPP